MNKGIQTALLGAAIAFAAHAFADDSPSAQPVKTPKAKMHQCMERQKAANTGLSKEEMKKACERELRTLDDHPSIPVSPNGSPAPHDSPSPNGSP